MATRYWPRDWAPPWKVALRLLVFGPMLVCRVGFCLGVLIGWGPTDARRMWGTMA